MGQKAEKKKACALDKDEQEEYDKYLVRWLIQGLQPFTVVENPSFRAFINSLCSRYDIPDRHKAKGKFYLMFFPSSYYIISNFILLKLELITSTFDTKRMEIIKKLRQVTGQFSLTSDMWTSTINREAFLGLTIHYIDSNWNLCNFLLDIFPFTIKHSGMNIAQEIMRVLEEFNITGKIIALTTDNDSAMLVCGKELASTFNNEFSSMGFSHYRCAAHVLNLGVKKGLKIISNSVVKARKIMTMIKNSTRHCDSLRAFCTLKRIKYLKPILDVETRWNLTFYMLKRFKVLKPALLLLAADNCSINDLYPDINDWNSIEVSC